MSIRHQTTQGGNVARRQHEARGHDAKHAAAASTTMRTLLAAAVAASAIIASAAGGTGIETEIVGERDSVAFDGVPPALVPKPVADRGTV